MTGQRAEPLVQVTAGLIWRDGRVLIARRPPGSHLAGFWEFPGGKQEAGENLRTCLEREIREELGLEVQVAEELMAIRHDYETRRICLHVFACVAREGEPQGLQGQEIRWVAPQDLRRHRFPPPDEAVIEYITRHRRPGSDP